MTQAIEYAEQHAAYRDAHPEEFRKVEWISAQEAAERLGILKTAVKRRIHRNRWPLGHARVRTLEGQPQPQWEVTQASIDSMSPSP